MENDLHFFVAGGVLDPLASPFVRVLIFPVIAFIFHDKVLDAFALC